MRQWIDLCESGAGGVHMVPVTPSLVKLVIGCANKISSGWSAEVRRKGYSITQLVHDKIAEINREEPIGPTMMLSRQELRPEADIPAISDVGCHWTWGANPGAQHHDNAYDQYGRENVIEITLTAEVPFQAIDWVFTLATNLVLPGEEEITVKDGSMIRLEEVFWKNNSLHLNRSAHVSGFYVVD